MNAAHVAPSETDRIEIGLAFADQRTGEVRAVVYADAKVVLSRDEDGHTTLTPRDTFESLLGSRYRVRPAAEPDVDLGPLGRRAVDRSGAFVDEEGDDAAADGDEAEASETDGDAADEREAPVDFEAIDGIGPETAGQLRATGYVTEADVRRASDDELLAVTGVGPTALAAIREALA